MVFSYTSSPVYRKSVWQSFYHVPVCVIDLSKSMNRQSEDLCGNMGGGGQLPDMNLVCSELAFVKLLRSPGIDSQPGGPVRRTGSPSYIVRREIDSLESIPGLLKRLQIRAHSLFCEVHHRH